MANGERLRCTSLGMSTFEVDGSYVSGSVQSPLATYPVTVEGDRLTITL
jgi:Rieske Fe-S protein